MAGSAPKFAGLDPLPAAEPSAGARWILALATALAALRLFRLGEWGLWVDEAYTLADFHHSLGGEQNFNPLGYLAIGLTVRLCGGVPDEFALRLLPALVGIACVPLSYYAFAPALGARRAAWAALLLALSAWHVYWSQSARFYTLVQASSLLGTGLFLRGLWAGGSARRRLLLVGAGVLVCGASASFHPSGAFLLPGLAVGLWALYALEPDSRPALRPSALLLALLAVLGLALLAAVGAGVLEHHARQKPVVSAASGVAHLLKTSGFFFSPPLLAGALVGALVALRRREAVLRFVLVVVVLSFAIPLAISTRAQMTAQYAFFVLPWVGLLACAPLAPVARRGNGRALELGYLALLALPALANLGLYFGLREGERARWREAFHFVADQRREGDLVLAMGSAIGEYYLGRGSTELRRPIAISSLAEWFPNDPRRWTRHERRIWVVVRPQWIEGFREPDQRMLNAWLRDECKLVRRIAGEMEGRDLDVLVYLRE